MAWSVNDLTSITDLLTTQLTAAVKASPMYVSHNFPFDVSGLMPAVSRTEGTNVMSLYLLHVGRDPYWRNTPVQGQRAQLNTSQPLSLNLSYLLTTYAEKNWQMEQYLMSVALSYFHANPIYKSPTAEFTVTVDADSIEEMSRLWQAITVPIRLSAMFRVAVVFLQPSLPPVTDSRRPDVASLSVGGDLNAPDPVPEPEPQLFEVAMQLAYRVAPGESDSTQITVLPGPPVVVAGGSIRMRGSGLDGVDASSVFLSTAAGEWPLPSTWRKLGTSASGTAGDADELVVRLDEAYAALPAPGTALTATAPPGKYLIAVGNSGTGFRSNTLPVTIAPRVDGIGPGDPVLQPDVSKVYTMSVAGLVSPGTTVLLETVALADGAAPAPGVAKINVATGTITWMLPTPAGFPSGSYVRVRVVVNAIEAPPGWWVQIP